MSSSPPAEAERVRRRQTVVVVGSVLAGLTVGIVCSAAIFRSDRGGLSTASGLVKDRAEADARPRPGVLEVSDLPSNPQAAIGIRQRRTRAPRSAEQIGAGKKDLLDYWQMMLSRFDNEPVNATWASTSAAMFRRDLEQILKPTGIRLLTVQCRSLTCRARLEFKNYSDAELHYELLIRADYELNCGKETILPEPDRVTDPYVATVLYHCSGA